MRPGGGGGGAKNVKLKLLPNILDKRTPYLSLDFNIVCFLIENIPSEDFI